MLDILVSLVTIISNFFFLNIRPFFLPAPTPTLTIDPLQKIVTSLTLKDKIRQTLICGFSENDLLNYSIILEQCGNLIYLKASFAGLKEADILSLNQLIHQKDPLSWIMIDQEGGSVNRLQDSSPSPRKMVETKSVAYWGKEHGKLLKGLGFDVNLAPVADITENNSAIKNRSFADDPIINGQYATEYLQALQNQGIIGVVKHLPGHGRADYDSHRELSSLNYSWEEINHFDLIPFINTTQGGAKIFMVGHLIIPELDATPSSLSRIVLEKLRSTLPMANDLIFITDSLAMKGVGLPPDQGVVEAFKSGEDMVILDQPQTFDILNQLTLLYQNGTLDTDRLDQSVYRILKVKSQFGKNLGSSQ